MATGEHKITFDVQKEFVNQLYPVLQSLEKAPQVIMYLEVIESQDDADELSNESEEDRWTRLNKKIHALFDEIGKEKEVKGSEVKETIKEELIKKKIIKSSLKELNVEQQMKVVSDLQDMLIDEKFLE